MAKLYFYYSSMNAGKSTTLLQSSFNYRERGMETMLWTAAVDDRYGRGRHGKGRIVSRIGLDAQADLFDPATDLFAAIAARQARTPLSCVLIDEAQFLNEEQVWQVAAVCDRLNIPVLCYGIRTDFQGKLFEGSAALLGLADTLTEIKTICECGRKATMNLRVDAEGRPIREGEQTEIGGNDRYVALCRRHFVERRSGC
ncbi:thymidine kinase [Sphingobium sp. PNB]|uniref:thymidine kinase n=1 Tax=Sphingobium sp. PNB TaxID=863934 RepID=UPI001CA3F38E|nr:thymidine kinase [Sphingobium sp. PNB]MCB4861791.1 thymidine kinase [Sphingobium sp. PNB]